MAIDLTDKETGTPDLTVNELFVAPGAPEWQMIYEKVLALEAEITELKKYDSRINSNQTRISALESDLPEEVGALDTRIDSLETTAAGLGTAATKGVANNLTQASAGVNVLDAYQGKQLDTRVKALETTASGLGTASTKSVANNVTTAASGSAVLDAYQGKVLNDKITGLGTAAHRGVANNLTQSGSGVNVLDAYQGKLIADRLAKVEGRVVAKGTLNPTTSPVTVQLANDNMYLVMTAVFGTSGVGGGRYKHGIVAVAQGSSSIGPQGAFMTLAESAASAGQTCDITVEGTVLTLTTQGTTYNKYAVFRIT